MMEALLQTYREAKRRPARTGGLVSVGAAFAEGSHAPGAVLARRDEQGRPPLQALGIDVCATSLQECPVHAHCDAHIKSDISYGGNGAYILSGGLVSWAYKHTVVFWARRTAKTFRTLP